MPKYWYFIPKDSKFLMCTIINLLKQCFLLLIILCTYLERCSNFELEANQIFYLTVFQCKWVSGVNTYEAEIATNSIILEPFAKKSAECLNLRNSFITISIYCYDCFKLWVTESKLNTSIITFLLNFSICMTKRNLKISWFKSWLEFFF